MISHQGDISVLNGFAFLYCKGIKLYAFSQKTTVTKQPYVALCKTWFFFRTFLLSSRLYCRFRNWSCLTGSAYARGLYRRSGTSPCPEEFSLFIFIQESEQASPAFIPILLIRWYFIPCPAICQALSYVFPDCCKQTVTTSHPSILLPHISITCLHIL